jgi:hypothetical protein
LTGNIWGPAIAAILLWSIIEEVIASMLYSYMGHVWLAIALKILLSLAIGFPLLYSLVKEYGTVELDESK